MRTICGLVTEYGQCAADSAVPETGIPFIQVSAEAFDPTLAERSGTVAGRSTRNSP